MYRRKSEEGEKESNRERARERESERESQREREREIEKERERERERYSRISTFSLSLSVYIYIYTYTYMHMYIYTYMYTHILPVAYCLLPVCSFLRVRSVGSGLAVPYVDQCWQILTNIDKYWQKMINTHPFPKRRMSKKKQKCLWQALKRRKWGLGLPIHIKIQLNH